jgi:hypothetical protein
MITVQNNKGEELLIETIKANLKQISCSHEYIPMGNGTQSCCKCYKTINIKNGKERN